MQRFGHQSISTWSLGQARPLDEWRQVVAALKREALIDEVGEAYPVLALNEASWGILRGNARLSVALAPKAERLSKRELKKQGRAGKVPAEASGTPGSEALFQQLRALRKQLADAQNIAPYMVFADTALRAMSVAEPTTLAAFAEIAGVGAVKLEKYGPAFLALIVRQGKGS